GVLVETGAIVRGGEGRGGGHGQHGDHDASVARFTEPRGRRRGNKMRPMALDTTSRIQNVGSTRSVPPVRDRLLAAGKDLFAAEGYENATTAAIARLAGTSES